MKSEIHKNRWEQLPVSAELKVSQWRFLTDIVKDVSEALGISLYESRSLLALYEIDRVRPLLVSNGGQDFVDHSDENSSNFASSVIRYQLGERNSFLQPDSVVQDAAGRLDIAIPIPTLRDWQSTHSLTFSVAHWETWNRDTLPVLEKAGLLYRNLCVNKFTLASTEDNAVHDNRSPATVSFTQLQQLSGHTRPGEICAWLAQLDIPYKLGARRRPFTTTMAINRALGIGDDNVPEKRIITV